MKQRVSLDRTQTAEVGRGRPGFWRSAYIWLFALAVFAALIAAGDRLYIEVFGANKLIEIGAVASLIFVVAGLVALVAVVGRRAASMAGEMREWRAIGDALPFACIAIDGRGRGVYWNAHFAAAWPEQAHAPLAALTAGLGGGEAAAACLAELSAAVEAGGTASEELPWSCATGATSSWEWVRVTARSMADHAGPGHEAIDRRSLWTIEDITAEWALKDWTARLERRLDDFVELAPVGFYETDETGRITFMNRTLGDWLGLDARSVAQLDVHLHELLETAPLPITPAYLPFTGAGETIEGEIVLSGDKAAPFAAYITVAPDNQRRGVVRNLTPERRLERALNLAEERFRRFFLETPSPIALLDVTGRITGTNRAWRVVADRLKPDGDDLVSLVAAKDRGKFETWLGAAIAAPGVHDLLGVRLADGQDDDGQKAAEGSADEGGAEEGGEASEVSFSVARIEDERGGLRELVLQLHDGPQVEGVQSGQAQKMAAIGQLAGGVAHDFNNLLTAMIGFCDLLLARHSPGDPSFGDIMQIKQNANRAANLVRQLLAFSRQQTMRPTVVDIADILADLNNLLCRLIGNDVTLEMVHGRDLGLVRADQGQLEQVIINLAVNARDAMPQGGTLTIETGPISFSELQRRGGETVAAGDYVSIGVADTGTGMTEETLERMFEPFFTTKDVGAGTGLGMSTVYGIIKQTGGHIFVETELGSGTRFEILLPVAADAEREAAQGQESTTDLTGTGTVLLVEDEAAVRLFGARALREKGYTVIEAENGPMALECLRDTDGSVDLLITDVMMPEMDGPTLVREVRARLPNIPVICISGYAEDSFRDDLGSAKDISFLPKPFSLQELATMVKEAISG